MDSICIIPIYEKTKIDNTVKKVAAAIINRDMSKIGKEASKFDHIYSELIAV